MTIKDVLLRNEWCVNIEPTETDGKIFVLTTKSNLDVARQWLDKNLPIIFTHHLPKNSTFTPNPDNLIAKCTDQQHLTSMLLDYADALKATLPPSQLQTSTKASKFARPPPNRPPPLVNISYKQAATNEAATNTNQKHNNTPRNATHKMPTAQTPKLPLT